MTRNNPTCWGQYYPLELGVAIFIPICMFAVGVKNHWVGIVRLAAAISVPGIIWNRLNTSMIAYNWQLYAEIPALEGDQDTITIYSLSFLTYRFILYRLPILHEWKGEK